MRETDSVNPLERLGLRDVVLPAEPGGWPPAPGWWLVLGAALLGLMLIGGILWIRRRPDRAEPVDASTSGSQEIDLIEARWRAGASDVQLLRELSACLRRVAIRAYGAERVAALHGTAWLACLDGPLGGTAFRTGIGTVFASEPFRRVARVSDPGALLALCRRWLTAVDEAPD